MTRELVGLVGVICGIVLIVVAVCLLGLWADSNMQHRIKKQAEEKQRVERMEEENKLLKVKCGGWQMEYVE